MLHRVESLRRAIQPVERLCAQQEGVGHLLADQARLLGKPPSHRLGRLEVPPRHSRARGQPKRRRRRRRPPDEAVRQGGRRLDPSRLEGDHGQAELGVEPTWRCRQRLAKQGLGLSGAARRA